MIASLYICHDFLYKKLGATNSCRVKCTYQYIVYYKQLMLVLDDVLSPNYR